MIDGTIVLECGISVGKVTLNRYEPYSSTLSVFSLWNQSKFKLQYDKMGHPHFARSEMLVDEARSYHRAICPRCAH